MDRLSYRSGAHKPPAFDAKQRTLAPSRTAIPEPPAAAAPRPTLAARLVGLLHPPGAGDRKAPAAQDQRLPQPTLGANAPDERRAALAEARRASPPLNALCDLLEQRISYHSPAYQAAKPELLAPLVAQLVGLLGGAAISDDDLHLLIPVVGHDHMQGTYILRNLVHALGPDIRPHQLRAVMDGCAFVAGNIADGLPFIHKALQTSGVLLGPNRVPVLRAWLTGLSGHGVVDYEGWLDHLVPEAPLDEAARGRWKCELDSGVAAAASILRDLAPGRLHLVMRMKKALGKLAKELDLHAQSEQLLPAFWRATARTWGRMSPERAWSMASTLSLSCPGRAQSWLETLLAARVPSHLLACACHAMARPDKPLDLDALLKDSPPARAGLVRLAWTVGHVPTDLAPSAPAASAESGLDADDDSACGSDWRPRWHRLFHHPLDALTVLRGEERFEVLRGLCMVRRISNVPLPNLEREVRADQRDAVLLRLPQITPWAMTMPDLERLHAGFMARLRADPAWIPENVELDSKSAAAAHGGDVTELLGFYESFLAAFGLELRGEQAFPGHTPEQARVKALDLSAALGRIVQQQGPQKDRHWFEARQIEWFKAVLARLRPLLGPSEEFAQAVAAVRRAPNAARQEMAVDTLRRQFVDSARQPETGVRDALAECLAQDSPREDVAALACGLLPALMRGPREDLVRRLQLGVMRPLLEAEQLSDASRVWVLSRVFCTIEAGDGGWQGWVDALLDRDLPLTDDRRLRLFRELALPEDSKTAKAMLKHVESLGHVSAPLLTRLRHILAATGTLAAKK